MKRIFIEIDKFCNWLPIFNILHNIAITSLFDAINRETKELLPHSIFIIAGRYKRVEIWQWILKCIFIETDKFCNWLPISNILHNIATTSLFDAIDRETKELLPHSIFIIAGRYKRVEIRQWKRRFLVYFDALFHQSWSHKLLDSRGEIPLGVILWGERLCTTQPHKPTKGKRVTGLMPVTAVQNNICTRWRCHLTISL